MKHLSKYKIFESGNTTKVLFISGEDDFCAMCFESKYKGVKVSDIINNINDYKSTENDDASWELSVLTFGQIDENFIDFIRNDIQDYDLSKDKQFYLETETI